VSTWGLPLPASLVLGEGAGAALAGTQCQRCGVTSFPPTVRCTNCGSSSFELHPLPNRGRLYAFSVVPNATADETDTAAPFAAGYVDLGPDVRVFAHLDGAAIDQFRIDGPVRLVITETRGDGEPSLVFRVVPDGG
jgi:uncharacterized OB-fold protein